MPPKNTKGKKTAAAAKATKKDAKPTRASAVKAVKKGKTVSGKVETASVEDKIPEKEPKTTKKEQTSQEPEIKVKEAAIEKAVSELAKWNANKKNSPEKKDSLFDEDEDTNLFLQVTAVKFFSKKQTLKPKVVQLPHPVYDLKNDFKVCLFVKDNLIDSATLAEIESAEIPHLAKVISAKELKGEYKSYEARRKLLNQYDLFLSDDNLITTLPKLLGKIFYSTSKLPVPVRLNSAKNAISVTTLTNQIKKIVSSVHYVPPMGVNLSINLGNLNQDVSKLKENVKAFVLTLEGTPIRMIQLKLQDSPGLPIYITEKLYTEEDVLTEEKAAAGKSEAPVVKLSQFEKGLVELAYDEEQVESIIGKKVKKVEQLKKKRTKADTEKKPQSKKRKTQK